MANKPLLRSHSRRRVYLDLTHFNHAGLTNAEIWDVVSQHPSTPTPEIVFEEDTFYLTFYMDERNEAKPLVEELHWMLWGFLLAKGKE